MQYRANKLEKSFAYSAIYLAILGYPLVNLAMAEEATQLNDVYVTGKKKATRKDNEVTGLGKIVKSSDTISREQVLGIRDLVRYDPGVTIVEQGRGGSAGYAIRGVDKNRIALVVDGLPQAQSYVVQGNSSRARQGGGSINEVENENIASVEISKGASSAEYGSGSLGGAIGFRTKEPSDLIKEGKNWGLTTKSAYSSKNEQYTNSLGFAARHNGFEGLVQYTHKNGKSIQLHKDAVHTTNYHITRLGAYEQMYDFRGEPNKKYSSWFVLENECQAGNCTPKPKSSVTDSHFRYEHLRQGQFTPEEKAEIEKIPHIKETVSAEEYTGDDRVIPDPMKYKTDSWLAKLGYHFNGKHYVGGVLEHTKQRYDIRDMTVKSYYSGAEKDKFRQSTGIYAGNHIADGLFIRDSADDRAVAAGLRWSRTQYHDENHRKVRKGLVYRYRGNEKSFFDEASFSYDDQEIVLDTQTHNPHCVEYPKADKNCRPSVDKPWSYYGSERNKYTEKHHLVKLSLDKKWSAWKTKHNTNLTTGFDKFQSTLSRADYFESYSIINADIIQGNGEFNNPYVYRIKNREVLHNNLCDTLRSSYRDCSTRVIKGDNKFIALRDNIAINKYLDIGLGGRYDIHRFRSSDSWTASKNYKTLSWNTGVVVKPTKHISFSYRMSNGFRVPSFQEMFGYRTPGFVKGEHDKYYKPSDLEPEKALNKEFGIGFKGNFGSLEMSYFRNEYRGLIALADLANPTFVGQTYNYYNAQDVKLAGVNLVGKIDWNGIVDALPEGLYSTLAYNRVKPRSIENRSGLESIRSYVFDAVQPSRYIFGLGYEEPENNQWGLNVMMTYSKAKNPNEIQSKTFNRLKNKEQTVNAAERTAKSWYIFDVVGHYNVKDFLTLRAGIYNLMNYRYSTWESIRQSASGAINKHHDVGNYARYAAPGRNFVLSLEMKF